jgi:glyoxylase-like metal-dependent hydrolase (beta-lactamase superfamily II)
MLTGEGPNLSQLAGAVLEPSPADQFLDEPQTVDFAGVGLKVLHTPGHTPGGICLHSPDWGLLFCGDTLFAGSVGRTDFPGGDTRVLVNSIRKKLLPMAEDTDVYPGHGPATTIGREKKSNPFL